MIETFGIFIMVSTISLRSKRNNRVIGICSKIPRVVTVIS
jgi:hypothetical protein